MSNIDTYEIGYIGPFWARIDGDSPAGKVEIVIRHGEWQVYPTIYRPLGTTLTDLRVMAQQACQTVLEEWTEQVDEFDTTIEMH